MQYRAGKHIYADQRRSAHGYIAGQTGRQIQCSAGRYVDRVQGRKVYKYSTGHTIYIQ